MDPCFIVGLADEGHAQLESCLGFLRAAYPDAPVKVISDGVMDHAHRVVCGRHGSEYIEGRFLKRIECGGAWWKRALEAGVSTGKPWIFKIDPDARIWRKFRGKPGHEIAGTMENAGTDQENIQGGIQAISRDAARRILSRNRFDDGALKSEWTFLTTESNRRQWRALAYLSTDKTLGWLARDAGIGWGDWPEIGSKWLAPAPANSDRRFAATHPHKIEESPRFADATLDVITTVKGRLSHLKQTLPGWLEPGVRVTVVDYDCHEGTADWVRKHYPSVRVVHVHKRDKFSLPKARNFGAAHLPHGADWLCFFDADWVCAPGWSDAVRSRLKAGRYLLANPINWSQFGSVVVRRRDFRAAGGYDELFHGWGAEDGDFYARLRHVGIRPGSFPGAYFSSIKHDDDSRVEHYHDKDKARNQKVHELYLRKKVWAMLALGRLTTHDENLTLKLEVYEELGMAVPDWFYPILKEGCSDVTVYAGLEEAGQGPGNPMMAARPYAMAAEPAPAPAADPVNPLAPRPGSPMMTFALHARDARMEWSVDIGHFIEKGLGVDATSPTTKVAPIEHVSD